MNIHDDLAVEWSDIEGEGLVRVFPVADFKQGFGLVGLIGAAADAVQYYPEVTLGSQKVIVTVAEDPDGLAHQLAHTIDQAIADAAD